MRWLLDLSINQVRRFVSRKMHFAVKSESGYATLFIRSFRSGGFQHGLPL